MSGPLEMDQLFICGFAKSGTTLVPSLLEGHPDLCVFPEETAVFKHAFAREKISNANKLHLMMTETRISWMARPYAIEEDFVGNSDYSAFDFERFRKEAGASFEASDGSIKALLDAIMGAFAEVTGQSGRRYWVEKSPGTESELSSIFSWYPDARALYVVRDPRDTYVSYARKRADISAPITAERFVPHWARSVATWKRHESDPRTMMIRYEDLLREPRATLERVCRWLHIDFDEVLLRPTKFGVPWVGNSYHGDRFEQISTAPIGRWKDNLSADELAVIEGFLGKEMQILGYERARAGSLAGGFATALWKCSDRRKRWRALRALWELYRPPLHHPSAVR